MTHFTPFYRSPNQAVGDFLNEHGAGLDRLYQAISTNPHASPTEEMRALIAQSVTQTSQELRSLLETGVAYLLDYVGVFWLRAPEGMASIELDAALRWYAARLTELNDAFFVPAPPSLAARLRTPE